MTMTFVTALRGVNFDELNTDHPINMGADFMIQQ